MDVIGGETREREDIALEQERKRLKQPRIKKRADSDR